MARVQTKPEKPVDAALLRIDRMPVPQDRPRSMDWSGLLPAAALGTALAADAFAAALCQGVGVRTNHHARALVIGGAFGAAQAIAPLLGWAVGAACAGLVAAVDHWIAFGILAVLGGKLIKEGLSPGGADAVPATGRALLWLAIATSIDAVAAGVALPTMDIAPLFAAATIGVVTFVISAGGVYLGRAVGAALGGKAEVFGGVVLIAIGCRILVEHGAFG